MPTTGRRRMWRASSLPRPSTAREDGEGREAHGPLSRTNRRDTRTDARAREVAARRGERLAVAPRMPSTPLRRVAPRSAVRVSVTLPPLAPCSRAPARTTATSARSRRDPLRRSRRRAAEARRTAAWNRGAGPAGAPSGSSGNGQATGAGAGGDPGAGGGIINGAASVGVGGAPRCRWGSAGVGGLPGAGGNQSSGVDAAAASRRAAQRYSSTLIP